MWFLYPQSLGDSMLYTSPLMEPGSLPRSLAPSHPAIYDSDFDSHSLLNPRFGYHIDELTTCQQ